MATADEETIVPTVQNVTRDGHSVRVRLAIGTPEPASPTWSVELPEPVELQRDDEVVVEMEFQGQPVPGIRPIRLGNDATIRYVFSGPSAVFPGEQQLCLLA